MDLEVPRNFWSRLAGRFGIKAYWTKMGPEASIVNAVHAIDACWREPSGRSKCSTVADPELDMIQDQGTSGGPFGGLFGGQ